MTSGKQVRALDTPTLLRLLDVPASTLNSWVSKGFCQPTLNVGAGRRATRYWTVEDLLVLRSIKELRSAGCSLKLIGQVDHRLRASFDRGLSNAVLYYDGKDVLVEEQGTVVSLIAQAGQALFAETVRFLALPLGTWADEGAEHAEMVDISLIRERRAAIRATRASA